MDKHILEQYTDMRQEEFDLISRIQSLDAQILNMEVDTIVSDTVTRGKKGKKPLGVVKIEGFPSAEYQRKKGKLRRLKQSLAVKDNDLLDKLNEVEEYIEGISDSRIRRLMRLRYIDNLTWIQVAKQVHETPDSVRMAVERYLASEEVPD